MNHQTGLWSLLKAFATKACFTVGLCTTAYWSVAKIHQSMNPSRPESAAQVETSGLRDKVDHLAEQDSLGGLPSSRARVHTRNRIRHAGLMPAVAAAPAGSPAASPSDSPAAVASTGEPSPSPSPGSEAQLQAQEANAGPIAEPLYPNPYAYHQAMMEMAREEAAREVASKSVGPANGSGAPGLGQTVTGQLVQPASGPIYGGINLAANGNTTSVTSNLSSQDIQRLISTTIKASVPNIEMTVSARKADGSTDAHAKVWSNRWSVDRGVKSEATLTVRSNSEGYPVQFEASLNLEDRNNTLIPIQFSLKPTGSSAKSDVSNGKAVRVYTFSRSEIAILSNTSNSESLSNVTLRLVYDVSGASTLIEGTLGFTRSNVKTGPTAWDSTSSIQTADQLVVDQFPLSIKLEKSL